MKYWCAGSRVIDRLQPCGLRVDGYTSVENPTIKGWAWRVLIVMPDSWEDAGKPPSYEDAILGPWSMGQFSGCFTFGSIEIGVLGENCVVSKVNWVRSETCTGHARIQDFAFILPSYHVVIFLWSLTNRGRCHVINFTPSSSLPTNHTSIYAGP